MTAAPAGGGRGKEMLARGLRFRLISLNCPCGIIDVLKLCGGIIDLLLFVIRRDFTQKKNIFFYEI